MGKFNDLQPLMLPTDPPKSYGPPHVLLGFNEEATKKLFELCNIAQMADGNFEMGAIPRALFALTKIRDVCEIVIMEQDGQLPVHILMDRNKATEYMDSHIKFWINNNRNILGYGIKDIIQGKYKNDIDSHQGWIDIDDNVLFFVNEDMARGFRKWIVG